LPSMATLEKCASLISREFQWSSERQQEEINAVIQAYPFQQMETIVA
jgi:hypothetical protein